MKAPLSKSAAKLKSAVMKGFKVKGNKAKLNFSNTLQSILSSTRRVQQHALQDLVLYLRCGDTKLVRPFPEGQTPKRQRMAAKAGVIPAAVGALGAAPAQTRAFAAEVLHLLCTDNPRNRDQIGKAGAIKPLAALVADGAKEGATKAMVRASEEACESLWILAYAGDGNTGWNHSKGGMQSPCVTDALTRIVMKGKSYKAKMWGAAALGNIMADFDAVSSTLSKAARERILKKRGLVEEFVKLAGLGPVRPRTSRACWPGEAQTTQRNSKHIVAWGALHALNNCALLHESHGKMRRAGVVAVARRHLLSPDWLEAMKSELVLTNLGETMA